MVISEKCITISSWSFHCKGNEGCGFNGWCLINVIQYYMNIHAEYILLNSIAYWRISNAALFMLYNGENQGSRKPIFTIVHIRNQFILFILENSHGIATSNAHKLKKCYA